jgi:hypothetical protein
MEADPNPASLAKSPLATPYRTAAITPGANKAAAGRSRRKRFMEDQNNRIPQKLSVYEYYDQQPAI